MVFTVVVTGNHYLVDVVGGAAAVALAVGAALAWESFRDRGDDRQSLVPGGAVQIAS
jgi:membrane-associated phospholipid phosphatase